jgi:gluconolactonase
MHNEQLTLLPCFLLSLILTACGNAPVIHTAGSQLETPPVTTEIPVFVAPGAVTDANSLPQLFELIPVPGSYQFSEGPAVDVNGNIYFSDINAGKIYKWSPDGSVRVFLDTLNKPNGLMFDKNGNLIACEGGNGRLISIDPQGSVTVLADQYKGFRFNEPNDLWIDAQGGIYFTDPAYQSPTVQDGEHVYYILPDHSQVTRVISDMTHPNGLVGTPDGKTLYVADHGAGQTFAYTINSDGTLSNKRLFTAIGSDGMDLDASGNLYLTTPNQVMIFDARGNLLRSIPTFEDPTNVAFGGADGQTLFITARTDVYTTQMSAENPAIPTRTEGFTLTSPDMPADGRLPVEYTCDGASSTLALSWSGAPAATQSFSVIMHHTAGPDDVHWYWVVYNIPAEVTSLAKDFTDIGTLGTNSVNDRLEYAPPCSKGPGEKTYTYTIYALSAQPQLSVSADKVDRDTLLDAIKSITLDSAELNVVYARP